WLLRHPGAARRCGRPDAQLLHCALHQRGGELGHGLRTGRAVARGDAAALWRVPPLRQGRTQPGMTRMLRMPEFPRYATLADKLGWWLVRALCVAVLLFLLAPILVMVPLSFSDSSFLTYPIPGWSLK